MVKYIIRMDPSTYANSEYKSCSKMIEQVPARGWNSTNPQRKKEPLSGPVRGCNPTTPKWKKEPAPRRPDTHKHLSHICYQLIFILFQPNFRLRELIFPWYFLNSSILVHKLQYLFQSLFSSQFFYLTSKSRPTCSSASCPLFSKSPKNILISTIKERFNIRQTKSQFLNNHLLINIPFDRSTQ